MDSIKVFKDNSKEKLRLEAAAKLITAETGLKCDVKDIMFDAGQNWMWTTLVVTKDTTCIGSYQALYPKRHELIVYGEINDFMEAVAGVITDTNNKK